MDDLKKCLGCGVSLQDQNILQEGYTTSLENDFCQLNVPMSQKQLLEYFTVNYKKSDFVFCISPCSIKSKISDSE